ncbi:unnamed protein product [Lupinus luteus]|uniref:Uncharacterized protein n=1 Tax=Lupinus luteus TaxID=3873 RepID=A0AAV1W6R6_LUPLU
MSFSITQHPLSSNNFLQQNVTMSAVAARSFIRFAASRTANLAASSRPRTARSPFRIPNQSSLSNRTFSTRASLTLEISPFDFPINNHTSLKNVGFIFLPNHLSPRRRVS